MPQPIQHKETPRYEIVTNVNRRRILVVNEVIDIDREDGIEFEDFDAIFINVKGGLQESNMLAIRLASPLLSEKCRFKPCYVSSRLEKWMWKAEVITDGYARSPFDTRVAEGIEDIYINMRRLNFLLGTDPVVTHAEELFRLCRYAISRGNYTFSSHPTPGLSTGYMLLYYYTMWYENQELLQNDERTYFHNQLIKHGYIRRTRFLDRVHVCPHCHRSHLLFFESCPKCHSSNLRQEPIIHHFRCANVSPQSSYEWDGELKCPKCNRMLHHIGVDYDKPSTVYTCSECEHSFMYPDMRVTCTSSRKQLTTDELIPVNIEEYEFTPEGIKAFAANDIVRTINQVGFFGFSSMRDFEDYIREFARNDETSRDDVLIVIRFFVHDPVPDDVFLYDNVPPIVKAMRRFFNYKSAMWGNNYYFLHRVREGSIAIEQNHMEYELKSEMSDYQQVSPGFDFSLISSQVFHPNHDPDQFIETLEEDRH